MTHETEITIPVTIDAGYTKAYNGYREKGGAQITQDEPEEVEIFDVQFEQRDGTKISLNLPWKGIEPLEKEILKAFHEAQQEAID